ncbi:MAG: hypothetical protein QOJ50_356 [Cryptosporangiaceae bacterium]|jgi:uncharacterized protein YndB with AHSA1/START domain|nr:hypothetical protein [Cryptosporangiaceae bacterium]
MTTQLTTSTYVNRVYIKADRDRVWAAITDPEFNRQYGYQCPGEFSALEPGGRYAATPNDAMRGHGAPDVIIDGEIVEIDPPSKLVQTWRALFDPASAAEPLTRLTWELVEETPGLTILTVTHELDGAPATGAQVRGDRPDAGGGWPFILSDLKSYLETGKSMTES